MSATNHTNTKNLPVFVDSDKPSWLGDFNEAMTKIDAAFANYQAQIDALNAQINAQASRITALSARVVALDNGSSV